MPRRNPKHDDGGVSFRVDPATAVALMHDERTWWISTNEMTVSITTKKTRNGLTVVTDGPPIVRRFINQPAVNLERWMRKQGGLQWRRLT